VAATPFQAGETPIPNLYPPQGGSSAERERQMQLLQTMNQEFANVTRSIPTSRPGRGLTNWPRACSFPRPSVDFSGEPDHVKALYGIGEKETEEFGKQLLLAGVWPKREFGFIQICHAGGGNGAWDSHGDMENACALLPRDRQADCGIDQD
jgi:hypothetical protein